MRQPVNAQLGADHADVVGAVGDAAAWLGRGPAVAGPVVTNQSETAFGGIPFVRAVDMPGVRRARVDEDRPASRIAALLDS